MAEIDDFDIDASTARAWAEFQTRLSEVISVIDDSADLTISTAGPGRGGPFVRFSCPARDTVRAEAAANAVLDPIYRLPPEQLAALEALGWVPPQPEGAAGGDTFSFEGPQEDSDSISAMAVAALRDVYGVQHPVFLAPDQLAEILSTPPTLEDAPGLDVDDLTAVLPSSRSHLDTLVDAELQAIFGHQPLRDDEGDVAIRVGSAMLFLRTTPDAREVVLFAPVVHDVAGRSRAAEVLNDLNVEARWVKFQLIRDRVFVTASIPAKPFVPAHLQQAVAIMAETADSVDDELAIKLNGRTTFDGSGSV